MMPETRYAIVGDVHLAYQTVGDGPIDLVLADQWLALWPPEWDAEGNGWSFALYRGSR